MNDLYRFDITEYLGGTFLYSYESNGNDVVLFVEVVDVDNNCEFHIDGKSIGLTEDDFKECKDIEDCTLVIGKHVIKDNDSEVLTSFIDYFGRTLTEEIYQKTLNKDLEYKTEEESWTLNLLTGNSYSNTTLYQCVNLDDGCVEKVLELFRTNNTDGLHDLFFELDCDYYEVFNLWGDIGFERIEYEVLDENGNEVRNGDLLVSENNVFTYDEYQDSKVFDKQDNPQYLLVHEDTLKRSWNSFTVPKNIEVGGIEFIRNQDMKHGDWCLWGDTMTSIYTFKYCGKIYVSDEGGDCGSYGSDNFGLFKWDDNLKMYKLIGETQG